MNVRPRDGERYILYISKSPDFLITKTPLVSSGSMTLKEYIEWYGNIIMCVGSNFSSNDLFHTRGIFRNPYTVIEGGYAGIAMILHGFSGAVAQKFFPHKTTMEVIPVSSMQYILAKTLKLGDGYYYEQGMQKDITESLDEAKKKLAGFGIQHSPNFIKVASLARIYYTGE